MKRPARGVADNTRAIRAVIVAKARRGGRPRIPWKEKIALAVAVKTEMARGMSERKARAICGRRGYEAGGRRIQISAESVRDHILEVRALERRTRRLARPLLSQARPLLSQARRHVIEVLALKRHMRRVARPFLSHLFHTHSVRKLRK